jgi:glycosyltransferase involved in cell wall biosynthesis
VNDRAKAPFLAGAAALLFPIDWPEPFGLVMIEAMACGTPVIAYDCGSVREVVAPGRSGFIVDGPEQALAALARCTELPRRQVREDFERRFSARSMAQAYLEVYAAMSAPRRALARIAASM